MKQSLLQYLECPDCKSGFRVSRQDETEGEEIMKGELACSCRNYPIRNGVPRLLPVALDKKNWETAERFGEEWNQFSNISEIYEDQFLDWINPVEKDFFRDKTILDVGCGKGRHVLLAQKFGARVVVGLDMSHAVDAAFANTGRLPNVHIVQADINHSPLKPAFDYAFSIGVLHHTPDPKISFGNMVKLVKPGGAVSAWVYGREGNGWVVHIISPLRKITSRLPLFITKAFAFVLAVILQTGLVCFYRPARKRPWLKKILPYSDYLCNQSVFPFKENYSIAFDHLLPGIAFYIPKPEFSFWFENNGLQNVVITQRTGNSWRGFGTKEA